MIGRVEVLNKLRINSKTGFFEKIKARLINAFGNHKSREDKESIDKIRASIIDQEIHKAYEQIDDYASGQKKVDVSSEAAIDRFVSEETERQSKTAAGISNFEVDVENEINEKATRIFSAKEYTTQEGKRVLVYKDNFVFNLRDSVYKYLIPIGQKVIFQGKDCFLIGSSESGGPVIFDGQYARELPISILENAIDKKDFTTYEKALSLLGADSVLGPEDITKAFGLSIENIKPIPFNEEEIKLHKALGHKLVYEVNRTPEGLPLTLAELSQRAGNNVIATNPDKTPKEYRLYKDQFDDATGKIKDAAWFSKEVGMLSETPEGEWKFVSTEVIPGTESKNYINQTDFLIKYFKDNIFKKSGIPEEYKKAFEAWDKDKPKIQQLITDAKWPEAAKELGEHPVSQLLRESFTSTVYRTITLQKSRNQKILPSNYSWSRSFSSDGILVNFGGFDAEGANVDGYWPVGDWTRMGAVFSRMKPLEIEL